MSMAAMAEPFEHIVNIPSTEGPIWNLVKIGQGVSETKFKDHMILYQYIAKRQEQITSAVKGLIITKMIYYFNNALSVVANSLSYILRKLFFNFFVRVCVCVRGGGGGGGASEL